ncbi:hypothetical protein T03_8635 [Trichinella britovi]|uniref:Uncharacterized protein n=1 Tax=Trichinella britovi TaxID=45882 RepID=A0A0V1CMG8_TRIBR|nr:hypothetical protein T03_8635 [Trichinella britovi]
MSVELKCDFSGDVRDGSETCALDNASYNCISLAFIQEFEQIPASKSC